LDEFASYLNFEQLPLYPHIADVFSTKQTFMTIIRPDNYIGLISGIVSPENVRDYLRYKIRYALTQSQDS
jgi:GTP cyclohydrolase III